MKDYSFVSRMIKNGTIKNVDELYQQVPKSTIAKVLNMNPTSFSNYRSAHPESFKLSEFIILAEFLSVSLESITSIFANSITYAHQEN
ncbi:hypothetical protein Dfri01_58890 [Dyadobacter frigoris]|uniref:hypothetical protein n=1 Tax=Dyadobacter frigoris TaxID=2576211 RepID=UPI0024A380EE|nr:hypothetical protein [Dyadobacter frigoris]GLU56428.1 hypothetical protein Dfri01_58890 [Dyadobacter frigoris]